MKLARFDLSEWREEYGEKLEDIQRDYVLGECVELQLSETIDNKLSEALDVIQSAKTYMDVIGTPEQIAQAFAEHEEKMKIYEESGRVPKILGWVEMVDKNKKCKECPACAFYDKEANDA